MTQDHQDSLKKDIKTSKSNEGATASSPEDVKSFLVQSVNGPSLRFMTLRNRIDKTARASTSSMIAFTIF